MFNLYFYTYDPNTLAQTKETSENIHHLKLV